MAESLRMESILSSVCVHCGWREVDRPWHDKGCPVLVGLAEPEYAVPASTATDTKGSSDA